MPRWVKCLVNRPKIRPSFTLLELIVVMSVVVILAGVSVYQFRNGQTKQDLRTAADELTATWQEMQTRALAAVKTPPDAIYASTHFGERPAGNLNTEAHTLLIYGTRSSYFLPFFFYVPGPPEDSNYRLNPSFLIMACASPSQDVLEAGGFLPNEFYEEYGGPSWYQKLCWVPLPEYSPVLPLSVRVDQTTIKIGRNFQELYNYAINDWTFTNAFNFETCQPDPQINLPPAYTNSLTISMVPPQPKFYVNGKAGCKIIQFALRSVSNADALIWVRFDLNTGRISYYDNEPT